MFRLVNGQLSPRQEVVPELPPSRPLTPTEQMDIMRAIEEEEAQQSGEPNERDLEVRPSCVG